MNKLTTLLVKLFLATVVATFALLVGIVFTTAVFQNPQHPENLGRTWQDSLLIVTVLTLYAGYITKTVIAFLKNLD